MRSEVTDTHRGGPQEVTRRRWRLQAQERSLRRNQALATPCSWMSGLQTMRDEHVWLKLSRLWSLVRAARADHTARKLPREPERQMVLQDSGLTSAPLLWGEPGDVPPARAEEGLGLPAGPGQRGDAPLLSPQHSPSVVTAKRPRPEREC